MPNYWLDHIHLMSTDPLKTAEFYKKMFNAEQVAVREMGGGRVTVSLDLNGTTILIGSSIEDTVQNGLAHFGIRTDDLETAVEGLKAAGVNFSQEITEVRPGFKISFLSAPENVIIELQQGSL